MMLLMDVVIDGTHCPNHIRWTDNEEAAFELLSHLVSQGWQLRRAVLYQEETQLSLPIEAFDGRPVRPALQRVQQQWESVLGSQPHGLNRLTGWNHQLITYYQAQIAFLQKHIVYLEKAKTKNARRRNEPLRLRLDKQYDALLDTNRRMLTKTERIYQRVLMRGQ